MSWTRENYRTYMRVRILAKARGLDDTRHDPVDSPRSPQKDRPAMSLVLELPGGLKVLADNPVALAALIAQLTSATVPGISLLPPARVDLCRLCAKFLRRQHGLAVPGMRALRAATRIVAGEIAGARLHRTVEDEFDPL